MPSPLPETSNKKIPPELLRLVRSTPQEVIGKPVEETKKKLQRLEEVLNNMLAIALPS